MTTTVILDACRGVNLKPGDVERAIEEMRDTGIRISDSVSEITAAYRDGIGGRTAGGAP